MVSDVGIGIVVCYGQESIPAACAVESERKERANCGLSAMMAPCVASHAVVL